MRDSLKAIAAGFACLAAAPAAAEKAVDFDIDRMGNRDSGRGGELAPYLQCVPYARQVSGIEIYGDALSWWGQAQGRYATGNRPRVGAVMAFQPHRNMVLGHVAAVSKVIDSRSVLLDHANWSPIDGRRGQVEKGVLAIDVSPANDWSQVRVWYAPIGGLGTTAWPVSGFIYGGKTRPAPAIAAARPAVTPAKPANQAQREPSAKFLKAFASFK